MSLNFIEDLATDLEHGVSGAASQRFGWRNLGRFGAAASSVAAAGSGGALAAGVESSGGTVAIGITLLLMGLAGGVATSLDPHAESVRKSHKTFRYEQLWWDILIYAANELVAAEPVERSQRLSDFSRRRAEIGDESFDGPTAVCAHHSTAEAPR